MERAARDSSRRVEGDLSDGYLRENNFSVEIGRFSSLQYEVPLCSRSMVCLDIFQYYISNAYQQLSLIIKIIQPLHLTIELQESSASTNEPCSDHTHRAPQAYPISQIQSRHHTRRGQYSRSRQPHRMSIPQPPYYFTKQEIRTINQAKA